ncbi:MAG: Mut7-C RNAse domain-containing protein [bacterium]
MQDTNENQNGQPAATRLACDTMLGKLSRELRKLGVDTEYHRGIGGMRGYKRALEQNRVFLTRNSRLKELPGAVYVDSNDSAEQLVQVRARFGLAGGEPAEATAAPEPQPAAPPPPPGDRCLECNEPLEKVSREQARPSIPFFIYQIHYDFSRCPKCRRVYWPGSHARDMTRRVAPARPERGGGRAPAGRPRRGRGRGGSNRAGGTQHGDNS